MERRREHRIVLREFEVRLEETWHPVLDISRSSFRLDRSAVPEKDYGPRPVVFRTGIETFDAQAWLHRVRNDVGVFGYWHPPTRGPLPFLLHAPLPWEDDDGLPAGALAAL